MYSCQDVMACEHVDFRGKTMKDARYCGSWETSLSELGCTEPSGSPRHPIFQHGVKIQLLFAWMPG